VEVLDLASGNGLAQYQRVGLRQRYVQFEISSASGELLKLFF
jgi:hypothetical protein